MIRFPTMLSDTLNFPRWNKRCKPIRPLRVQDNACRLVQTQTIIRRTDTIQACADIHVRLFWPAAEPNVTHGRKSKTRTHPQGGDASTGTTWSLMIHRNELKACERSKLDGDRSPNQRPRKRQVASIRRAVLGAYRVDLASSSWIVQVPQVFVRSCVRSSCGCRRADAGQMHRFLSSMVVSESVRQQCVKDKL
jgi:hypothetical protein